jgi:superfamily II DNA or RNA helicase
MNKRDYQSEHIELIIAALSTRRKVLAQLPTGGGKTVEFSMITRRFVTTSEKSVLILVHREELMYQAAKTIEKITGFKPYLITSTTKKFSINKVYIGMVDSTLSRLHMIHNVGLVIIDECHVANFNKVHFVFLEELVIGFSATPKATSKKEPLNKYYSCIVTGPEIKDLIALGFLAQNITRCPSDSIDPSQFAVDKLKGDYNEGQMSTAYMAPRYVANVAKTYHRYCFGKKTIIFNVSIEHSKEVTECLSLCGHNVRHLDSNSTDRKEILQWFKETENAILCNVMIATVGFDEPTIENVIINFSTLSIVKFIQACGRGSRAISEEIMASLQPYYPYQLSTKHSFNIIDLGRNWEKFGDWNDDRDWEYIFNHPDQPGNGVAPVKTCPSCEGLVHAAVRVCQLKLSDGEFCLHEFERKKTSEEQDLEKLILITKGIDVDSLIGKNKKKYQYYTFLELGDEVVKNMFKKYGNLPSQNIVNDNFKAYYKLCIDWYAKEMSGKDGNMDDISDSAWHIKRALTNFNSLIKKYNEKYDFNIKEFTPIEFYQHHNQD